MTRQGKDAPIYVMNAHTKSGFTTPFNFNTCTALRQAVSLTPRLLYHWGESRWYPWKRKLFGVHSRSGLVGEQKIPLSCRDMKSGPYSK